MQLTMAAPHSKSIAAVICSLLLCFTSAAHSDDGFTVDFIHRDSPKSPFYDPSHTRFQRIRNALDRSSSRKSSLVRSVSSFFDVPISPADGEYVMKISIGSPPQEQLGIADTGSDLTWLQCKCQDCYRQILPIFDPAKSSSYKKITCNSTVCKAAGELSSCDKTTDTCQYGSFYGDGSYTNGDVATETLTLAKNASFRNFAFGCGHNNEGTFGQIGASGIVGLGGGAISMINLLKTSIGGKFSYCLTPIDSNTTSKISFGSKAVVAGRRVVSTPLFKKVPDTFYYLQLEGVSVGSKRVDYSPTPMASGDDVEGNIIIDSGTTLTYLPTTMYKGVVAALAKAVAGKRVRDPLFGLCYAIKSGGGIKSPPVTAHFKGADLVLDAGSLFLEVREGVACLTLVETDNLSIFGNLHQINYRIGYDLQKKQLNFLPTDCSKLR